MLQYFPQEIIIIIDNFIQTNNLSHVCLYLWNILKYRHINSKYIYIFRTLDMTKIYSLSLYFNNYFIKNQDIKSFLQIKKMPQLVYLTIKLSNNNLTHNEIKKLMNIKSIHTLEYLELHLSGNKIGNIGSKYIGELYLLHNIKKIILFLDGCGIDNGIHYLSKLFRSKTLQYLFIDLQYNDIHFRKIFFDYYLQHNIKDIKLNFGNMCIGNINKLFSFGNLKFIKCLSLNFEYNNFLNSHISRLSQLNKLKNIEKLEINLENNNINRKNISYLCNIFNDHLTEISLDISNNNIENYDVKKLYNKFKKMNGLKLLAINFSGNKITGIKNILLFLSLSIFALKINITCNPIDNDEIDKIKKLDKKNYSIKNICIYFGLNKFDPYFFNCFYN